MSLAENCGESKIVSLLQAHHQSKSFAVKQTIVYILESVVGVPRYIDRDLNRIVNILVYYLSEGSLEIR